MKNKLNASADGLEQLDNGRGLIGSDKHFQVPSKPGHFVAGDIIRPHLLTTAIGQAWIAADSIDDYLKQAEHHHQPQGGRAPLQPAPEDDRGQPGPRGIQRRDAGGPARDLQRDLGDSQLRGSLRGRGHSSGRALPWTLQLPPAQPA